MLAYFVLVVRICFPWYPPPILGLAALLVASGIDVSCRVFQDNRIRVTGWILGIGLTAIFMVTLPVTYASEGLVQHLVEDRVRMPRRSLASRPCRPGRLRDRGMPGISRLLFSSAVS